MLGTDGVGEDREPNYMMLDTVRDVDLHAQKEGALLILYLDLLAQ